MKSSVHASQPTICGPRRASGMWRAIAACVDKFKEGTRFKAGRGDIIKFWTDLWYDGSSMASRFPSLNRLSLNPSGEICHFYSVTCNQVIWDIPLRRNLYDTTDLLQSLASTIINPNLEDCIVWWPDKSGLFSIKSFYTWSSTSSGTATVNPKIWSSKAPQRPISFVWTAALGKILTQDNLEKRGRIMASACPLCLQVSEESNHLLLHCPSSSKVWCLVLDQFSVSWIMPPSIAQLSFSWDIASVSSKCSSLWQLSFFVIL